MRHDYGKIPVISAILIMIAFVVIVGGRYFYSEYHTYYRDSVREFETAALEHGSWVLTTEKKELLGKVYAAFTVSEGESGGELYRCPDLFPVSDVISVRWEASGDDILVETVSGGVIRYQAAGKSWRRAEESGG